YGAKIGSGENTSSEQIHSNRSRSDSVRGAPYISPRRNGSNTLHFATKERFSVLIDWRRGCSRSGPVLGGRAEPRNPGVNGISVTLALGLQWRPGSTRICSA